MFDENTLRNVLQARFGFPDFRPGQLPIVKAVLAGQPTLAVMPTGAGKSLCYQLPAMVLPGLTLVVSPLVALMKDQVDALRRRGIDARLVNSSQTEAERTEVERAVSAGETHFVFVAPERFRSPGFRRAIANVPLALVAVDEAHCISEWGHAFRPDYERLGDAIAELKPPRLLALTATASPDVRADILRALRMRSPKVEVAGFDRPNIHLEVHTLATEAEKFDTLVAALRAHSPAIVYTATRRLAAQYADRLSRLGLRAAPYHAGLEPDERARTQEAFLAGDVPIVTATNAFGLGIDKPDVRVVVHTEVPRSLEAYYQEVGRAGRDGRPALGVLFYAPKDIFLQKHLMQLASPRPQIVIAMWNALRREGRPMTREELEKATSVKKASGDQFASLAFLESTGAVARTYLPSTVRISLGADVSADGETGASVLARTMGTRRGVLPEEVAGRALGCRTRRELYAALDALAGERRLTYVAGKPRVAYHAPQEGALRDADLDRLRTRLSRDRARLEQMLQLATRPTCRRRALLKALGEPSPGKTCDACDVCRGHRITTVRSRLDSLKGGGARLDA